LLQITNRNALIQITAIATEHYHICVVNCVFV